MKTIKHTAIIAATVIAISSEHANGGYDYCGSRTIN